MLGCCGKTQGKLQDQCGANVLCFKTFLRPILLVIRACVFAGALKQTYYSSSQGGESSVCSDVFKVSAQDWQSSLDHSAVDGISSNKKGKSHISYKQMQTAESMATDFSYYI